MQDWEHQVRGRRLLHEQDATMLIWEMGTGKTRPVIMSIAEQQPQFVLILCPKSIISVWDAEFKKHLGDPSDHKVNVVCLTKGTAAKKVTKASEELKKFVGTGWTTVIVVNYETARQKAMGDAFLKLMWDIVILDESHRVKAPGGKTSRWVTRLGKRAKKRICLTGTPMPHSPMDIYAQYRFLDPSIFGTNFVEFRSEYAQMGGYRVNGVGVQIQKFINQPRMHRKIFGIADRVRKEEVLDLPPAVHEVIPVVLPPKSMKVYKELKEELIAEIEEGVVTIANAMVKVGKLQQITSGFIKRDDGVIVPMNTAKLDALKDFFMDVGEDPVVIFTRFRQYEIDAITEMAKSMERQLDWIHGGKDTVGAKWEPDKFGCLIAQVQAGGIGKDFTKSAHCVFFSQTFNLGDYDQALARLHRAGQLRSVSYYHLIAVDTVDPSIRKALDTRRKPIDHVLDTEHATDEVVAEQRDVANMIINEIRGLEGMAPCLN